MNGCAYCIDMHSKDARAHGESEQRLYGLSAWRDAPYYTERERAALAWTEELTLIAENHVSDEVYEQTRRQFSEQEIVDLTLAVVTINAWNRIAISFRPEVGTCQPRAVEPNCAVSEPCSGSDQWKIDSTREDQINSFV